MDQATQSPPVLAPDVANDSDWCLVFMTLFAPSLGFPLTIRLRPEPALSDVIRPRRHNRCPGLRRKSTCRVRNPLNRTRIDRDTSARYATAVPAHGMRLALPRGFVESVWRQASSGHLILSTAPTELDVRPSELAKTAGARLVTTLVSASR